ncbi:unnamed protein product [Lactuca saligna]|uniref:Uncharacterized protein n=1 Tax=Lactuca saligna TaxID=75948 RepID=A0AA36EDR3_LACSI|nr:unnamed protein product [Lactuca saligna]
MSFHNSACQHAAPTFVNLMNAGILRHATHNKNMTIQTRNHPLPITGSQRLQREDLDAFSVAIVVSIAFSFTPASFAIAIMKTRLRAMVAGDEFRIRRRRNKDATIVKV